MDRDIVYPPITTKQQMYDLLWTDKLGNHFKWQTAKEFLQEIDGTSISDYYNMLFSIRIGKQLGAPWEYDKSIHSILLLLARYYNILSELSIITKPKIVDKYSIMTAEIIRLPITGLELFYTTESIYNRELTRLGKTLSGIKAIELLKYHCNVNSYDMLMGLLDKYPDHVIETNIYKMDVGNISGHNAIVWEVRKY